MVHIKKKKKVSVIFLSLLLATLGLRGRFSSFAGSGGYSLVVLQGLLMVVASLLGKHRLLVLWLQ